MFKRRPDYIHTYLGYGTSNRLRASGRALKDKRIHLKENLGWFQALRNSYKQFESDEIPNAIIKLVLEKGASYITRTNEEGYYHFDEASEQIQLSLSDTQWVPYTVFYAKQSEPGVDNMIFKGEMLIPSPDASYGIISDIDDTIVHTGVASLFKWRVLVNTVFKNFDKRKPLLGTASWYTKLQKGTGAKSLNPIFYISNSPWNLYGYLRAFLKQQGFPKGPILLRDFRTPFDKTPKPKIPHKQSEIINVLKLYPKMKFILIGDTGEKDADIYTQIALNYPGRVLAIYLISVKYKRKDRRIQKIISDFTEVPILIVQDKIQAEEHAKCMGFIV